MNKIERIFNIQFQYLKITALKFLSCKKENEVIFNSVSCDDPVNELIFSSINYYGSFYDLKSNRLLNSGFKSNHGLDIDAIEGVCRLLPILTVVYIKGNDKKLKALIRSIIIKGCAESGTGSFGKASDYSQLIVEMADVALSIALLKNCNDDIFDDSEYEGIFTYLARVSKLLVFDNNWKLFRFFISSVVRKYSLISVNNDSMLKDLSFIKKCYISDGWFTDGVGGEIDYYSLWQFNFFIFWIDHLNLYEGDEFFNKILKLDGNRWKYYFDKNGIPPLWGRSVSYKLASSFPLFSYALNSEDKYDRRVAATILRKSIAYYKNNGGISKLNYFSQGYFVDNVSLMDHYSGVNSSLWNFRSLMVYYYFDFIKEENVLLPSETHDCDFFVSALNATLYSNGGTVFLENHELVKKEEVKKNKKVDYCFELIFKIPRRKVVNKKRIQYKVISSKNDMYR